MSAPATLELRGVRKAYRGRDVVGVDSLAIGAGRTLALLGPSGSGKSTLLGIAGLLLKPDAGEVRLDGESVDHRDRVARLQMAAAFQRPYLFKGTIAQNVAYGLKLRGMNSADARSRVAAVLDRVGLGGWEDRSAAALSGGEAQRVALARALVLEPRVLLLDEPLASLDPVIKWRLAREFATILRAEGITTLYVTHDQDEAMVVADDVAIMREGAIASCGPSDQVFSVPVDDWTAGFIGMEPSLRGRVTEVSDGVARIDCGGTDVFAVASPEVGSEVLVGIRPEDVLLFGGDEGLPPLSARNVLHGAVAEMSSSGATYRVVVEAGHLRIAARISRAAAADLGLAVGSIVTAVFKASAVRVGLSGGLR
jgi:tungstate transport system ATP-binding protein